MWIKYEFIEAGALVYVSSANAKIPAVMAPSLRVNTVGTNQEKSQN